MSEYIERDKAIDACFEGWDNNAHDCADNIRSIPAADVRPVVLCRDCKRYGGRPWGNNENGICIRTDCGVGEDDFCSYGEKREES